MRKIGLFEVKKRLPALVGRAAQGQETGIMRRGKLAAVIVPARPKISLKEIFNNIEAIRNRAKLPQGVTVEDLIEEGRV
jgi:antitoxin (DNA-binding transcriptional repressor) of toxin-antitoxin stability system